MALIDYYRLYNSARDNSKHRWAYLNGKNQQEANMAKVFSLINSDVIALEYEMAA